MAGATEMEVEAPKLQDEVRLTISPQNEVFIYEVKNGKELRHDPKTPAEWSKYENMMLTGKLNINMALTVSDVEKHPGLGGSGFGDKVVNHLIATRGQPIVKDSIEYNAAIRIMATHAFNQGRLGMNFNQLGILKLMPPGTPDQKMEWTKGNLQKQRAEIPAAPKPKTTSATAKETPTTSKRNARELEKDDGENENQSRKKQKKMSRRSANFLLVLKVLMETAVQVLKDLGLSPLEIRVEQNLESVVRLIAFAENNGPRASRDGRNPSVEEGTVNLVDKDGNVHQRKLNLGEVKTQFRQMWPSKEDFDIPESSGMNVESTMYTHMALILRTIGVSDKMFAPGRSTVTAAGMPAATTTLTNGSSIPGRFVSHARWTQGIFSDAKALIAAKKSGKSRGNRTIFDIIKTNMSRRMTSSTLGSMCLSLVQTMTENELTESLKTILLGCLAFPARESRAFMPTLSSIVQALQSDGIDGRDFLYDGSQALDLNSHHPPIYALSTGFTARDSRAQMFFKMVGSVFVSASILKFICPTATYSRSKVQERTSRIRNGQKYDVKRVAPEMKGYEVRVESESGGQGTTWQINAQTSYGRSSYNYSALMSEITGKAAGRESSMAISRLAQRLRREIMQKKAERTKVLIRTDEEAPIEVEAGSEGFFTTNFEDEGVTASERIAAALEARTGEDDDGEYLSDTEFDYEQPYSPSDRTFRSFK